MATQIKDNKVLCNLQGHNPETEWVEFDPRITIGDWRRWKIADAQETLVLLEKFIRDWNLENVDGTWANSPREFAREPGWLEKASEKLELKFTGWLIRAATEFYIEQQQLRPES